jgi:signal transduction histidine kinase
MKRILLVIAGVAVASAAHTLTPPRYELWHAIFQRIYYLPIVFAAISFGWRGGLPAAALSGLLCVATWSADAHHAMNQYAEVVVFFLVGGVTGVLADRERKRELELQRVNRELQESFAQIRRADRLSAVGELSASLAHEIRNPLASIEGAAEIVDESSGPEEIREFRGIILKECRRLNGLLTSLLDFARPRAPELREANVDRVFDSVIELAAHAAGKTGVRITKEIAPKLPSLVCDSEQLRQVMLNLVINATQAMPRGGTIVLSAGPHESGVEIRVRDEGSGIPETDLDKIFNPFFTTKKEGTGLGLSVVHQIVTQHGGSVSAQRNPDGGMTFRLLFPRVPEGRAA